MRQLLLSDALRTDIEHMFAAGLDKMAIRYARLAADARDLETEVSKLRNYEQATRETIVWDTPYPGEARMLTELRTAEETIEKLRLQLALLTEEG